MKIYDFTETEIIINSDFEISGTLTLPSKNEEKFPCVILVPGSGDIDRDGTIKDLNLRTNMYKELAEYITSLGFATLRYDKRGVGKSKGDFKMTGMWDFVKDVTEIFKYAESHSQIDESNIILLGHSEGCTLITAATKEVPTNGLILLSGAAEPVIDALKRQRSIAYNDMLNAKGFKGIIYRFLKIDKLGEAQSSKLNSKILNSTSDTIRFNFVKINAKWFREHFTYNVFEDLRNVKCPVLAITGSKDCQVTPERVKDVSNYAQGKSEYYIIENMDHGLKEYYGEISILNIKNQYSNAVKLPIHPELLKNLSKWLINNY